LYVLDGRQYRSAQVCNRGDKLGSSIVDPDRCRLWNDPNRSYLGAAQERWLQTEFAAAAARPSTWNVLGQQTLFGPRNFAQAPARKLWNDGWDGYSAARRRLTDDLQTYRVSNPVILGGDVHENWVGHVKADYAKAESASIGVEFCGTSITSHSGKTDQAAQMLAENPHFVFSDAASRGYGVADFSPSELVVQLRVLDDVKSKDAQVQTLATFVVNAGRAMVNRR
jgi:alkaline phosphatase D